MKTGHRFERSHGSGVDLATSLKPGQAARVKSPPHPRMETSPPYRTLISAKEGTGQVQSIAPIPVLYSLLTQICIPIHGFLRLIGLPAP